MANLRRDSSPGLGAVAMTPVLPTVNVMYSDEAQSKDRQGIIDITADVQNFLAAIAELKQAMEGVDATSDSEGTCTYCSYNYRDGPVLSLTHDIVLYIRDIKCQFDLQVHVLQ